MCRIIPKRIDTLVVSYGGVGTTFLIEFFDRYRSVNDAYDRDGLKHLPVQPMALNPEMKVVYVFGDPVEAVTSLFRRGFHSTQSLKLSNRLFPHRPVAHTTSLEEYAHQLRDDMMLHSHFSEWLANAMQYPTLFVRYDDIWNSLPSILNFLDIPQDQASHFPVRKSRSSSLSKIDSDALRCLDATYADLRLQQNEMGSIHTLYPSRRLSTHARLLLLLKIRNGWMTPAQTAMWRAKQWVGASKKTKVDQ